MSLSLDKSERSDFIRFCSRFCGSNAAAKASSGPVRLKLGRQATLCQINTIIRYLVRAVDAEDEFLGGDALERAQVAQWMSFALNLLDGVCPSGAANHLKVLNVVLETKTYFVGNRSSMADAALFWIVSKDLKSMSENEWKQFPNVCRWFDLLQRASGIRGSKYHELLALPMPQWRLLP